MKTSSKNRQPLTPETATAEQWRCIKVVAMGLGTYPAYLKAIPWGKGVRISFLGDVATYDSNLLTRLVLAAHRFAIRISIASGGPHRVAIEAHPRDPKGLRIMDRHTSLDDLQAMAEMWKQDEEIAVADPKGGE